MKKLSQSEEFSAGMRIKNIDQTMKDFGIAKRFVNRTLDNYEAKTDGQKHALGTAREIAETVGNSRPRNAIFTGRPGTGKNHLVAGITRELILAKKIVVASTMIKMIQHFRSAWNHGAEESEKEVYEKYTLADLLILDEVGTQYGTDSEHIIIFDILNERYGSELSSLLVSNLGMTELRDYVSERLIDRLKEDGCDIVVFDWQSYRGTPRDRKVPE